ncbi:MAG TPA: YicC family protein [Candidatus Tidjanibacter gallistercoris]|nr:YicC family protein [Candidatus Tidjanibacter gallistercoris]
MTGYGKAAGTSDNKKITVEIRSLNSKQLDMSVRTPQAYRPFEYEIRSRIGKAVQRGKVDVYINVETETAAIPVHINRELFMAYYEVLREVGSGMADGGRGMDPALMTAILKMPEVISGESGEVSDAEREVLLRTVDEALAAFDAFRLQEGRTLIDDLLARIGKIEAYRKSIEPYEARRVGIIKERIRENIASVGIPVDENRLEQEMIFYVEKLDITEEKVRLDNHCRYFRQVAADEEHAGRKLGFIAQEMGREINTLGSKANDSDIQKTVVMMKDELEKIKEQVLNIL